MGSDLLREDGRVRNPQAIDTEDTKLWVHDTVSSRFRDSRSAHLRASQYVSGHVKADGCEIRTG